MNITKLKMVQFYRYVMANPQIGVRLSPQQLAIIDALVESGDFGSRTEFVQYAVRKMLLQLQDGRGRL